MTVTNTDKLNRRAVRNLTIRKVLGFLKQPAFLPAMVVAATGDGSRLNDGQKRSAGNAYREAARAFRQLDAQHSTTSPEYETIAFHACHCYRELYSYYQQARTQGRDEPLDSYRLRADKLYRIFGVLEDDFSLEDDLGFLADVTRSPGISAIASGRYEWQVEQRPVRENGEEVDSVTIYRLLDGSGRPLYEME